MASNRLGWVRAIRFAPKPACRYTVTRWGSVPASSAKRDLGVAEGGFGSYVKPYKPWFIGREAYIAREKERKGVVVRFRFDDQRVRLAHNGDP